MASDGPKVEPMRSAYLTLTVESSEEAERIYTALSEGGQIFMPITETFFALKFAQLRDKFGTNWMIIHERPARLEHRSAFQILPERVGQLGA